MEKKQLNIHGYFKTGEFAKLCRVKKQTLFHYDEIGLFSPDIVEPNGYRYYSTNQLEQFEVIQILKNLDMPLKDIRNYMDNRSPNDFVSLFKGKSMEIDKKIEDLLWQKKYMNEKLKIVTDIFDKPMETPLTEDMDEEYFIATEYTGPDDERKITDAVLKHLRYCTSMDVYSPHVIGGMIPTDTMPTESFYNYAFFYTRLTEEDRNKRTYTKHSGKYAVIYHLGSYDTIYGSYEKLVSYCKLNGYSMGEYFYENEIQNEFMVASPKDYVIKIEAEISQNV